MQEMQKTENPNITVLVCGVWRNRNVLINSVLESRSSAPFIGVHDSGSKKEIVTGYLYCCSGKCKQDNIPKAVFTWPEELSTDRTLTTEEFLRFLTLLGMQDILSGARLRACVYLVRHDGNDWQFPPKSLRPDVARAKEIARSREDWSEMDNVRRLPVYESSVMNLREKFSVYGVSPARTEKDLRN